MALTAPQRVDAEPGQTLVVVVRDAHRYEWQRAVVESLVRDAPHVIVVETGLPVWRPAGAAAFVATYGGGRANLEAAVDVLARAQRPASSAGATPSR